VRFGLRTTRAGGTAANVGRHHLLVDEDATDLDLSQPIPTDRKHLHLGGGQTKTRLDLPAGKHSFQLVLEDAEHKLFKSPLISKKATATVLDPHGGGARSVSAT
jgi:hypothetical protein